MPDAFDAVTQRTVPAAVTSGRKKPHPNSSAFAAGEAIKPTPLDPHKVQIRRDVALPAVAPGRDMSAYKALLDRMVKNDSVVLTTHQARSMVSAAKKAGIKVAVRRIDADTSGVWRLS